MELKRDGVEERCCARPCAWAAAVPFECVPLLTAASITPAAADKYVAFLSSAPRPVLIQCSTATRAGTASHLYIFSQFNFKPFVAVCRRLSPLPAGCPRLTPVVAGHRRFTQNPLKSSHFILTAGVRFNLKVN